MEAPSRIGILGGTFDPIHYGHLAIADAVRDALGLERVILIPAGRPWLKAGRRVADSAHRLAMARLGVAGRDGFEVSAMEVERSGPTYTVDTLTELRRELGDDAAPHLILGMDSIRELGRWREPERLFDLCRIVAVSRPDTPDVSPAELAREFPSSAGKLTIARGPMLNISATEIRRRAAEGASISEFVPPGVERYILENGLYAPEPPTVYNDATPNSGGQP